MRTSDMKRLGEAWASVTSKKLEEGKTDKQEDKGQFAYVASQAKKNGDKEFVFAGKKYKVDSPEVEEALTKKEDASNDKSDDGDGLDKADPKAAKKKFKDRKDKDIDNDGDVDDSDKFLHKRRKAIGKAMAKDEQNGEDENGEEKDGEEAPEKDDKKKKKVVGNDGEKKAEISKIGEATEELIGMLETAAKQQKSNATKPEGIMDKESGKSKEFANAHDKSDKKMEDNVEDAKDKTTKAGQATKPKSGKRPQDNPAGDTQVVKSTEAPVKEDVDVDAKEGSVSLVDAARAVLSGKTMSELKQEVEKKDKKLVKEKNPFDGRTTAARKFLERMAKRRGYINDEEDNC